MALPPSPIPAGPPPGAAPPPPDMGAAPPDDMGDEGGEDEVIATISRTPDGKYKLMAGDEPEEGEGDEGTGMPLGAPGAAPGAKPAGPEPQTFDTPQALVRALIPLLDEGTKGAEDAFSGKPSPAGVGAPPMGGM